MFVWIVFAGLTALAAVAVLVPYARGHRAVDGASFDDADAMGGSDAEVYKDQLQEIEKDEARGVLSDVEAQAARIEISRRLLKASDIGSNITESEEAKAPSKWRSRLVLMTAFLIVPVSAVALYGAFGAPGMPDRPLADRVASSIENQDVAILVARVEGVLNEDPDDVRGWSLLAPIYTRQGKFFEARNAFEQLIRLQGEDPGLLTDLGEVIVIENQGMVTQEAMTRFVRALDAEPSFPKARYYRALGLAQEGRSDEAEAILQALRNDGGPDSPWAQSVDALLADLDSVQQMPNVAQGQISAPDDQAAAAIAALPQAEQQAAIDAMVAGLVTRLTVEPDDLAGWSQLIRSYAVLNQPENARRSLLTALNHFEDDDPARLRLLTIAEQLQIDARP